MGWAVFVFVVYWGRYTDTYELAREGAGSRCCCTCILVTSWCHVRKITGFATMSLMGKMDRPPQGFMLQRAHKTGWRDGIRIAHALSSLVSHLQSTLLFHKWCVWHKRNLLAMEIQLGKSSTYHRSCSCLVHLVLSCLDFGLQVCRGMKVLAFLPRASTFDVIHANCNSIFICVYHCNIYRVSIAAIILTTCAISTLKLSTNLKRKSHY